MMVLLEQHQHKEATDGDSITRLAADQGGSEAIHHGHDAPPASGQVSSQARRLLQGPPGRPGGSGPDSGMDVLHSAARGPPPCDLGGIVAESGSSLELPSKPLAKREMPPNPYSPQKEPRAFYYYRSVCQWAHRDLALHIASKLRQYTELVTLTAIGT